MRRGWFGAAVAVVGLAALTGLLVPVRGELTLASVTMADGSRFGISGAPSGAIVMPPHSSVEIGVSFDGDNSKPVSDRVVIHYGAGGGSTAEVFVRNGEPRRRSAAH
jgi:hypothetical protein